MTIDLGKECVGIAGFPALLTGIIKPFDPTVLLSRVNAVFRRLKVTAA